MGRAQIGKRASPDAARIRLLVLDRHRLTRDCLVAAFESGAADVEIQGASDPEEVGSRDNGVAPADVAIVNLGSDEFDETSLGALRDRLGPVLPSGALIVMTDQTDSGHVLAAARQGVTGFLPGATSVAVTREIVRLVAAGWLVYPRWTEGEGGREQVLLARAVRPRPRGDMTPRQREVLDGLTRGLTNRAIGDTLGISERAVKLHVQKLMQSMGVSNRTQIVARLSGACD